MFNWCSKNGLSLNCSKCKVMSFSRKPIIAHRYFLGQNLLIRTDSFNDLGILLDAKLSFNSHIEVMINKARSMLGFIKRWSKEFKDPYVTKRLYTALVRPILEYGSIIWSPQYAVHANKIESVQKQFLLFALRGLNWSSRVDLPPYESRLLLINLPPLQARRCMLGNVFLGKLLNGTVDAPFLLHRVNFNVPARRTRFFELLKLSTSSTNYETFEPFKVLCREFNAAYQSFEFK